MLPATKPISRHQFLKKSVQLTLGLLGTASLSGVYSRYIEPYWIEVKQVDVTLTGLPPSFNEFRIFHFSDLHLGFNSKPEHLSELEEQIQQIKPPPSPM